MRRLLACAGLEAMADDAIRTVLPIVAVIHLMADGTLLGFMNALSFVWFLLAHRVIGHLVDRLGGRRAIVVGAVVRSLAAVGIVIALATNGLGVTLLLLAAPVIGFGDALATTSFSVLVPQWLGVDRLTDYYSRHEMLTAVTLSVAPLAVAWGLQASGATLVVGWVGGLYLAAVLFLATTRAPGPDPARTARNGHAGARFGLLRVLRTRGLAELTMATALQNGAAMATGTLLPLLVIQVLGLTESTIPLLSGAAALGALVGARAAPRLRSRWGPGSTRWIAGWVVALIALGMTGTAFLSPTVALVVLLGLEFSAAAGLTIGSVATADVPVRLVPPEALGQAFTSIRWFTVGSMPASAILGGVIASSWGIVAGLVAAAAACSLALLPLRRLASSALTDGEGGSMEFSVTGRSCSFCGAQGGAERRLLGGLGAMICILCMERYYDDLHGRSASSGLIEGRPPWESMTSADLLHVLPAVEATARQAQGFLRDWVDLARARGLSWADIAGALGVSRQAAWERYSRPENQPEHHGEGSPPSV